MSVMKLRHTPTSPYVRKVMVVAHETGQVEDIEILPTEVWARDTDIARDNPLGKVPALMTPDGTLCDSPLCCEYLDSRHGGRRLLPSGGPERWRILALAAYGDGIIDAAVLSTMERLRRPKELFWQGQIDRQKQKIGQTLDLLEARAEELAGEPHLGAVTVGCALGYLDLRLPELSWRSSRPQLAAWYERFSARPSMLATAPPAA